VTKLVIGSQMGADFDRHLSDIDGIEIVGLPNVQPWEKAMDVDVLWASPHTGGWLGNPPRPAKWPGRLRWTQCASAGVDGAPDWFFDVQLVTATRGNNSAPIADYALLTILAHDKRWDDIRIHQAKDWNYFPNPPLRRLEGQTLAILGYGRIGSEIAKRALAFGMTVKAYRRSAAPAAEGVEVCASLGETVKDADHVAIAIALTDDTRHLVNAELLGLMKPGVHIVNVARGPVLDQAALLDALESGQVGGASLDVTDPEPLPDGHPLYHHPRVSITPHCSWSNRENSERVAKHFAANIQRYRNSEPMVDVVDLSLGY
jgi:phosphoglycerate dehydrogenase-like enzyme